MRIKTSVKTRALLRDVVLVVGLIIMGSFIKNSLHAGPADNRLTVKKTADFKVDGAGSARNWESTDWIIIPPRRTLGDPLETALKVLYSDSGMYFLFRCQDRKITATMTEDFMDLWNEDVVEVFLWPDEDFPIYFEYELSPLNYELPILVPNLKGKFLGWRPWHYEGNRRVIHATAAQGGELKSGAEISSWTAEFYIPYELLTPLGNIPPVKGTVWRANFYRCDYDRGSSETWTWQPVEKRFHEYHKFGYLHFDE